MDGTVSFVAIQTSNPQGQRPSALKKPDGAFGDGPSFSRFRHLPYAVHFPQCPLSNGQCSLSGEQCPVLGWLSPSATVPDRSGCQTGNLTVPACIWLSRPPSLLHAKTVMVQRDQLPVPHFSQKAVKLSRPGQDKDVFSHLLCGNIFSA